MVDYRIWITAQFSNLPVIIVDTTDVYERVYDETKRHTYSNGHTVATTVATMRTAWAFVGKSNMILPMGHRVYVREPERAIDRVDDVYASFKQVAALRDCVIHYNGWIVWCGRPEVIATWADKLRP